MAKKDSFRERKLQLNKTRSMQFCILATIIFAMLAVTVFIGGISIYEVDQYIQEESENFVALTCEKEGAQINDIFDSMEKSVMIMESYVMGFFTEDVLITDPDFQKTVIDSAERMFADVAKHANDAVAYYFRLDPAISDGEAGLFYSKTKESDTYVPFPLTDLSLYEKGDTEHVGWYWQPYEAGEPVWMQPYYNQNNNIHMISYVVPLYHRGAFIGVVGMDFDYTVLEKRVQDIKIYTHGFASLEMEEPAMGGDAGDFAPEAENHPEKYLRASKALTNGMTLTLSASYDDIRQNQYEIGFKIVFVVIVLAVLFTAVAIAVVRRIVAPLKKIADASAKLSNGNYNVEFIESNISEIALLNTAFENMVMHLHERERELHFSANRDSLTGVRNTTSYKSWVAEFDREIEGKTANFGVAVFDLNQLKKANDTYGHDIGDKLIVTAAKAISDVFKRSPVFRIGGDEFVAILRHKDLEAREHLFAQLDAECGKTFADDKGEVPVSIARGFARFDPKQDLCFHDVFIRADHAMYQNKRKDSADLSHQ